MSESSVKLLNGLEDVTRHAVADLLYFTSMGDLARCKDVKRKWSLEARQQQTLGQNAVAHLLLTSTVAHCQTNNKHADFVMWLQVNASTCHDYDGRTPA